MTKIDLEAMWDKLLKTLDEGGPSALALAILAIDSAEGRNSAFRFVVRKIAFGTWDERLARRRLEDMIALGDATIAHAEANGLTEEANVTAYNMSANLCDCWGDSFPRERAHFEKGIAYAEQALAFRRKLQKGAAPFAMAYWVKGKHLLSLKRYTDAVEAFAAAEVYHPLPLHAAFLGLARLKAGDAAGAAQLALARSALAAKGDDDAKMFLEQLAFTEVHN